MRFKRITRPAVVCAGLSLLVGCERHCCRVYDPCAPATVQAGGAVYRYGDVCTTAPPGPSSPTIISDSPSRRTAIADAPAPRVVVSEPGRKSSKGWGKVDPESTAITKVEGALSSDTLNR